MPLNESTVEDAALSWFSDLGYAVGHGPDISPGGETRTPALSQRERVAPGGDIRTSALSPRESAAAGKRCLHVRLNRRLNLCELQADSVIRDFRRTAADGTTYEIQHHNRSAIIAA